MNNAGSDSRLVTTGSDENVEFFVSNLIIEKWQRVVDLLARSLGSSSARISRLLPECFETLLTSSNVSNPDKNGNQYSLKDKTLNWYCKKVCQDRKFHCTNDSSNDQAELGYESADRLTYNVKSYLGFPIELSDGRIFGTICVEDTTTTNYGVKEQEIVKELAHLVENDINHLLDVFNRYIELRDNDDLIADINVDLSSSIEHLKAMSKKLFSDNKNITDLTLYQSSQIEKLKRIIDRGIHLNSHKLRGPLARILGLIRILNMDFANSEEILSYLNKSAEELDEVIHEIQATLQSDC